MKWKYYLQLLQLLAAFVVGLQLLCTELRGLQQLQQETKGLLQQKNSSWQRLRQHPLPDSLRLNCYYGEQEFEMIKAVFLKDLSKAAD